jgi:hypothetical protein
MPEPLTDEEFEKDNELLLPPVQVRRWIVERMAELVQHRGYEHLVLAPLLEPSETYFPDPWLGGDESLRRLARRLLVYADLEDAEVEVKVHPDDDVGGAVAPAGIGAAVWLVRKQGHTLHLAARVSSLKDPLVLVPATARAVAEGWRALHGLTVGDAVDEQRRVDVTAVYLGFGRLTVDASIRHSTEAQGGFRLARKKTQLGVLAPQAQAYALAVQMRARQADGRQLRALAKGLQANQSGFFEAAVEALRRGEPDLARTLGVPPREQWSDPPDLADLTAPLRTGAHTGVFRELEDGPPPETRRDEDKGVVGMNAGRPVFRVERSKALRLAKMLALPVVLLGMLAGRMQMGIEIEMWKVGLAAAVLGILGLGVGRLLPDARCSEPKCGQPLAQDATVCPRCGGTVSGVIHHPRERLAAEEALAREAERDDAAT